MNFQRGRAGVLASIEEAGEFGLGNHTARAALDEIILHFCQGGQRVAEELDDVR